MNIDAIRILVFHMESIDAAVHNLNEAYKNYEQFVHMFDVYKEGDERGRADPISNPYWETARKLMEVRNEIGFQMLDFNDNIFESEIKRS